MPMLPAGALKDSVQTFRADTVCVPGVLADTFRISCLTDTLQLQSTRRKEARIHCDRPHPLRIYIMA